MKKLSKILVCLVLFVFSFMFVACGDPRTKSEKNFTYPTSSDATLGNGGLAVQKGNYIYFVNGYTSVGNITNKKDTYVLGSLMLMKLGPNGEIVTDSNGLLQDDYYITMNNKLCGYEVTNLFIHGNYLYFVSPCLENESGDEVWAKERVVFNRIKLDKSSEVEEIYKSGVQYDKLQYQYYETSGGLSILAWEQGESTYAENGKDALIRVNVGDKSSSVIDNNVTDVVFADSASEVVFKTTENSEYSLYSYNANEGLIEKFFTKSTDFDIIAVEQHQVFVSSKHSIGEASVDVHSYDFNTKNGKFIVADLWSSSISVSPDGDVILIAGNNIRVVNTKDDIKMVTDSDATSINLVGFKYGSIFFYDNNSALKRVSYSEMLNEGDENIYNLTTISTLEKNAQFDISDDDGESMMYFYNKSGSNYYLNRIQLNNNFGAFKEEMVGTYLAGDEPVEEEVEEEIEEE